jgi:hypothetical protein
MTAVGYLHGGRIGVSINGNNFHAKTLQLDDNFLAKLAGATE